MKKQLFSFFMLSVIVITTQAQITITSASMPSSGDTIRYSTTAAVAIPYSPTGANYFWDYSNLVMLIQDVYQYKAAMQTPYAFYFIGLNKYGLKVADSMGAGTFKFYDVYNFFTKTSLVYKTEGIGFKYTGIPLAAYYSDDDELYQFPMNYTDRDSSTYAFSVSLGTGISYSQKGYRINEVDGWGSIKTPYDSVACLRLISTSYGIDSINVNGFGFSFPNIQRSYKWLSTTEKIPVLEISGQYQNSIFVPVQARYRDIYRSPLSIQKQQVVDDAVFPNPSNGELMVQLTAKPNAYLKIYDINGKEIYLNECNEGKNKIDLRRLNISSGTYILIVYDQYNNPVLQRKLIIE